MRQFRTASGRLWTVEPTKVWKYRSGMSVQFDVLRFYTPGMQCDLNDWPDDWHRMPDPKLAALLNAALTEWIGSPEPTVPVDSQLPAR